MLRTESFSAKKRFRISDIVNLNQESDFKKFADCIEFFNQQLFNYNLLIINGKPTTDSIREIHQIVQTLLQGLNNTFNNQNPSLFIQFSLSQLLDNYLHLCLKLYFLGHVLPNIQEKFQPNLQTIIGKLQNSKDISILYHCECALETLKYMQENISDMKEMSTLLINGKKQAKNENNNNQSTDNNLSRNDLVVKCSINIGLANLPWYRTVLLLKEMLLFNRLGNPTIEGNLQIIFAPFQRLATSTNWLISTDWHIWHTLSLLAAQSLLHYSGNSEEWKNIIDVLLYLAGMEDQWRLRSDLKKHVQATLELRSVLANSDMVDKISIPLAKLKEFSLDKKYLENPGRKLLSLFASIFKSEQIPNSKKDSKYLIPNDKFVEIILKNNQKQNSTSLPLLFKKARRTLLAVEKNIGASIFAEYCYSEWSKGNLWPEFDFVFVIPVQHLTAEHYSEYKSIEIIDIIINECFSIFENTSNDWVLEFARSFIGQHYLAKQNAQDKILFILDWHHPTIAEMPPSLKQIVEKIFAERNVLVVTKIAKSPLLYEKFAPQDSLLAGPFSEQMVELYIDHYFQAVLLGSKNQKFIDEMNELSFVVKQIMHNTSMRERPGHPLYLKKICDLYDAGVPISTVTELHQELILHTFKKILSREASIFNLSDRVLSSIFSREQLFLEYLAFHFFDKTSFELLPAIAQFNKAKFPTLFVKLVSQHAGFIPAETYKNLTESDEISAVKSIRRISLTNLIQSDNGYDLINEVDPFTQIPCHFISRNIRNFFCAYYLLRNPVEKQPFLNKIPDLEKEAILMFISGIITYHLNNSLRILYRVDAENREKIEQDFYNNLLINFFEDLISDYDDAKYYRMFLRCWNEAQCDVNISSDCKVVLNARVEAWINITFNDIIDLLNTDTKKATIALTDFLQEINQNKFVFNKDSVIQCLQLITSQVDHKIMLDLVNLVNHSESFSECLQQTFRDKINPLSCKENKKDNFKRLNHSNMYPVSDNNNNAIQQPTQSLENVSYQFGNS